MAGSTECGSWRLSATRVAVSVFGALAALAGIEHGVGELLQGSAAPSSMVIESWPDTAGFDVVSGEPAMTVIPDLAVSGVVTILVALAMGVWAIWFVDRPRGGMILVGLSVLLLVVGGGFGPPMIGVIVGVTATRTGRDGGVRPGAMQTALARVWSWLLVAAVVGYLALVPGMVLASRFTGFDDARAVTALMVFAFTSLILAIVAARGYDRLAAASAPVAEEAKVASAQR